MMSHWICEYLFAAFHIFMVLSDVINHEHLMYQLHLKKYQIIKRVPGIYIIQCHKMVVFNNTGLVTHTDNGPKLQHNKTQHLLFVHSSAPQVVQFLEFGSHFSEFCVFMCFYNTSSPQGVKLCLSVRCAWGCRDAQDVFSDFLCCCSDLRGRSRDFSSQYIHFIVGVHTNTY